MQAKRGRTSSRTFIASAGLFVVLVAGLAIMAGCASTREKTLSTARKVHSMTPCGMMMGAMMEDGHGDHQSQSVHHEDESSVEEKSGP